MGVPSYLRISCRCGRLAANEFAAGVGTEAAQELAENFQSGSIAGGKDPESGAVP